MKKFLILPLLLSTTFVFSQHFEIIHVSEIENEQAFNYCVHNEDILGLIVYGEPDCPGQTWEWGFNNDPTIIVEGDSIVIYHT